MTTIATSAPLATADLGSGETNAYLPLAGRLLTAAIFLLSGLGKLAAPAATVGYIQSAGLPLPSVALIIALAIELGGGTLLVLGYRTRAAALLLAGFSLMTAFAFHLNLADQNQFIHFFKNFAIAGGLLQLATFGPGRFSLDRR